MICCGTCLDDILLQSGGIPNTLCPTCRQTIDYVDMPTGRCGPCGDLGLKAAGTRAEGTKLYVSLFSEPDEAAGGGAEEGGSATKVPADTVVVDGANVLFHQGRHERNWEALWSCVSSFLKSGVRPLVVLKATHFREIPPSMSQLRSLSLVSQQREVELTCNRTN